MCNLEYICEWIRKSYTKELFCVTSEIEITNT